MRTTLVSLGLVVVAAILGAVFLRTAPAASDGAPASPSATSTPSVAAVIVPFTVIAHGTQSKIDARVNYIITNEAELKDLWTLVKASGKAPNVDFTKNVVAAVFAGRQPTAGYDISVAKVEDAAARKVVVKIAKPDAGCVLAQSLTAPYQIIELPKTSLPFTHEDTWATTTCAK